MGAIVKFFKWLWNALVVIAPFSSAVWGVAIYSGIGVSLYVIVSQTSQVLASADAVFTQWGSNVSSSFVSVFESVSSNSFFQFFAYVLSLDVPFEWLRSCVSSFVSVWLSWLVGVVLVAAEVSLSVLGIYFVRSRLRKMTLGLGGSNG